MMGRTSLYLLMALLGTDGMALAATAPLQTSLCAADEHVYFSCQADKGAKQIALCGQVKGGSEGVRGFLQYRFGTHAHLDMAYPRAPDDSLDKFTFGGGYQKMGRMQGTEIAFRSGDFDYTVYTMSYPRGDAESDGYAREAGVRVARAGKDVATVTCAGEAQEDLGELSWLR